MQSKSPVFNLHLPVPMRDELRRLSALTGLSQADLMRLGLGKLFADRDALPQLPAAEVR